MKVEFSRSEVIAEKYEVVDLLGQNPIGLTYRVKHLDSGHYVRLTMLQPHLSAPERRGDLQQAHAFAKDLDHRTGHQGPETPPDCAPQPNLAVLMGPVAQKPERARVQQDGVRGVQDGDGKANRERGLE